MTFSPLPTAVRTFILSSALLCIVQGLSHADSLGDARAQLVQDTATAPTTSPEVTPIESISRRQQLIRTADSLLTTFILTQGIKSLVHSERPDGSGDDSFPSQHTSAAFAIATTQAHFHPKQAPYWYGAAALVGYQRVSSDKHHWRDVIAGAGLGYFTAKLELKQKKGLILRPFIREEAPGTRTAGISFGRQF